MTQAFLRSSPEDAAEQSADTVADSTDDTADTVADSTDHATDAVADICGGSAAPTAAGVATGGLTAA